MGGTTYRSCRSSPWPAARFPQPKANHIGETIMKKLVIAVALVVAFAAPAMAENFVNPYASTLGR